VLIEREASWRNTRRSVLIYIYKVNSATEEIPVRWAARLPGIWKETKERRWVDQKEWQEFRDEIEALPDDEMYVLVVAENP
jgi:hypothetical protein